MKTLIITCLLCMQLNAIGQIQDPVSIKFSAEKIDSRTYDIIATLTIKPTWHIYGLDGGDGPVSTSFSVKKHPLIKSVGHTKQKGKLIKKYEEVFSANVQYFENTAQFVQRIELKKAVAMCAPVEIEYMVCNEESCLPPSTQKACVTIL